MFADAKDINVSHIYINFYLISKYNQLYKYHTNLQVKQNYSISYETLKLDTLLKVG